MHSRLEPCIQQQSATRQMRYLCSGSLSTFRCVIASILTIGGYGSPTEGWCILCILSFYKEESRRERRSGEVEDPNPEAVDRECDTSFTQCVGVGGGQRGRGAVKQPFVDRPFSVHPYSTLASSRQQQGVICTYQLCLPATKGPSMTSLSLLYCDPMIQ